MTEHKLKLTPGTQNKVTGEYQKPWVCEVCNKTFNRHTNAKTCKGKD